MVQTDPACLLDWCRFIGFFIADGGLNHITNKEGREYWYVQLHQSNKKPKGLLWLRQLVQRIAVWWPIFNVVPFSNKENHKLTFTINCGRTMFDYLYPMISGPKSFDPFNDASCRSYSQAEYRAKLGTALDVEVVFTYSDIVLLGDWLYLRRWFYYGWIFLLCVRQARALLEGFIAADGEFSSLELALGGTSELHTRYVRGFNSSIPLIQDLSIVGLMAETRVNFAVGHAKGQFMPSINSYSRAVGWIISFSFDSPELTCPLPKPKAVVNPRHDGFLYCLTVPNGAFMARRKVHWQPGKGQTVLDTYAQPFFTGNVSLIHTRTSCLTTQFFNSHAVLLCTVSDGQADDGYAVPLVPPPRRQQGVPHPEPSVSLSPQ